MISINVKIQSVEDAEKGIGITNKPADKIVESDSLTVGILEAGMKSGATSLMFCLEMPDGSVAMAQCSAKQFRALSKALDGAEQRFSE